MSGPHSHLGDLATAPASLAVVTALPSSPHNGQPVAYQNEAMAAAGVVWCLRYNAASSSPHKWEFVGGAALYEEVGEQRGPFALAANTWTGNTIAAPQLTVPLLGVYDLMSETGLWTTAGGLRLYQGVPGILADPQDHYAAERWHHLYGAIRVEIAAATVLRQQYQIDAAGNLAVDASRLRIQPVRVS
jgi:hypothetical protein